MRMRIPVALLLVSSALQGQATPATPVGKGVSEWLDAFNSGDSTKLRAFYDRYRLVRNMKAQLDLRQLSGGFDLVSVAKSTPAYIEFVVKERSRDIQALGVAELNADGAQGMRQFALQAIPKGKQAAVFTIDAARRASVIEGAIRNLLDNYVFSDVAMKMADDLRARLKRGEYDDFTNAITFASRLTEDVRAVSKDKHLSVSFVAAPPTSTPGPVEPTSCGFTPVMESNGKVAVIKFDGFVNLTYQCGTEVTRTFEQVSDADALIFDLRENGGGDARMVAFISGYLFDKPTHLNDVMSRKRDAAGRLIVPDQFWTHESWANDPNVPGRKYGGTKPVYVLTSSYSFSAAEEFSYNLKALRRATIIGEQTGGGANPTRRERIDDQFTIAVPFARSVNPITKTNWEGTGVTPDVKVPAARALETARSLIGQRPRP